MQTQMSRYQDRDVHRAGSMTLLLSFGRGCRGSQDGSTWNQAQMEAGIGMNGLCVILA